MISGTIIELECKHRGEFQEMFDKLYNRTRRQIDGDISRQKSLLKTGDAAAFLVYALGSVVSLVNKGFQSVKTTGKALLQPTRKWPRMRHKVSQRTPMVPRV